MVAKENRLWKPSCLLGSCLMVPLLAIALLLFAGSLATRSPPKKAGPTRTVVEPGPTEKMQSSGPPKIKDPSTVEMNTWWDAWKSFSIDIGQWWKGDPPGIDMLKKDRANDAENARD